MARTRRQLCVASDLMARLMLKYGCSETARRRSGSMSIDSVNFNYNFISRNRFRLLQIIVYVDRNLVVRICNEEAENFCYDLRAWVFCRVHG